MKCPLCKSEYKKNMTCSNDECAMSWKQPKPPIEWKPLFWRTVYWTPKTGYRYLCNRFFNRYDLIRTGLPKGQWRDVDCRLEEGIKRLLVEYVEKEECFEVVDMDWHKMPNDESRTVGDEVRELYRMIKVDLPKLEIEADEALTEWAKDHHMHIGKSNGVTSPITFSYDEPEDVQKKRWDRLHEIEQEVIDMTTDILQRIITIRLYLWT